MISPADGEEFDPNDLDALIDAMEAAEAVAKTMSDFIQTCRAKLIARVHIEAGKRTARVAGQRRSVVISLPSPTWDQKSLAQLIGTLDAAERLSVGERQIRNAITATTTYKVDGRAVNKLRSFSGDSAFDYAWEALMACKREVGRPSIEIDQ